MTVTAVQSTSVVQTTQVVRADSGSAPQVVVQQPPQARIVDEAAIQRGVAMGRAWLADRQRDWSAVEAADLYRQIGALRSEEERAGFLGATQAALQGYVDPKGDYLKRVAVEVWKAAREAFSKEMQPKLDRLMTEVAKLPTGAGVAAAIPELQTVVEKRFDIIEDANGKFIGAVVSKVFPTPSR